MNKKLVASLFSLTLATLPLAVFAIEPVQQPDIGAAINPWNIFNAVLNFIWPIFVGIAILMFIYAGFMFLTANGEPSKLSTAKHAVIGGIVGVLVALLAYSLVNIITSFVQRAANMP